MSYSSSLHNAGARALIRCGTCEQAFASALECVPSTSGRSNSLPGAYSGFRTHTFWAEAKCALWPSANKYAAAARTTGGSTMQGMALLGAGRACLSGKVSAAVGARGDGAPFYAGLAQQYPNPDDVPEEVLQRIREALFGKPVQMEEKTGRRALARPLQGKMLADWYWTPPRDVPGFHNEEREYDLSKELNRRHRKTEGEEEEAGKVADKKKKK